MGYSRFTSGYRQNDDDAINEGKKAAADIVVILNSQYAESVTSTVPLTTPTTSTSVTNGMATAYGTGGSAVAFGNATTTTYGTSTTYVPMTVNRFQYEAVYLVKVHYHLGVKDRELSDRERQEIQSNRGVCVTTVIDGTPAYSNDILPGDIITAIDGYGTDFQSFNAMLSARTGKTTELTIFRQGNLISKSISLAP